MRFIRDIISERAEAKAQRSEAQSKPRTISTEPDAEATDIAENAPMPAVREATPRLIGNGPTDRTLTRLSEPWSLDDDDVFKRLLSEDSGNDSEEKAENLETPIPEAGNVFEDWDEPPAEAVELTDHSKKRPEPFETDETMTPGILPALEPEEPEKPRFYERTLTPAASEDDMAFNLKPSPLSALQSPQPIPKVNSETTQPENPADSLMSVPAPASGRSGRSAGRVKTRLLGFGTEEAAPPDPFKQPQPAAKEESPAQTTAMFPVGWLVIVSGPGRGASFPLHNGVSQIGRGEDQAIRLDFGDTSISRSNHAAIAYDEERDSFFLGHGGKANMVRLNDRPVLSTEDLQNGALVRIGETTLRFVALCDGTFNWSSDGD